MTFLLLMLACNKGAEDTGSKTTDSDPGTNPGENSAPTAPVVAITPEQPGDDDGLTVSIITPSTDVNGDAVTYTYAWSKDGVDAGQTGESIDAALTSEGETWSVSVTPTDGMANGEPGTASVYIGNQPPSAPVIHIDPSAPESGDTLTLVIDTAANDPEGEALTQTIRWYEDGAEHTTWQDQTSVDGGYVDGGETFRVVVEVSDGVNEPVSAEASVTVSNNAPEIDYIFIDPTAPSDSNDLEAVVRAIDPDGDSLNYSYVWYRDGVEATEVGDSDKVDADLTTAGEVWTVTVTVTDGSASDTESSDEVTIALPTVIRYNRSISATLTLGADGAWETLSGDWNLLLYTQGSVYGESDCDVFWDLSGTPDATVCPTCDFAFSFDATYDSAASTLNTSNCSDLAEDGTGTLSYRDRFEAVESYLFGPSIFIEYYGYPYEIMDFYMSFSGSGGYGGSGPGYYMSQSYSVNITYDSAGNMLFDAGMYAYLRMY